MLDLHICPLTQSSHDLFYRERAYVSQHRAGLAAVTDKPQMALASNTFVFALAACLLLVSRRPDCARFVSTFQVQGRRSSPQWSLMENKRQ